MKRNKILAFITAVILLGTSCKKALDVTPANDITDDAVYNSVGGYKQAMAKVYAAYALTGNAGPAGNGDVQGIDEGTSDFFRLYWCAQELTTDEAVIGWGDAGLPDLHNMSYTSNNNFLKGLYYRSIYQITLANDFIRQSADAKVSERGLSGSAAEITTFRNEARFLRAYQYWILLDLFANPPFVTENDAIGTTIPKQTSRAELFAYIESELKDLETKLADAKQNEYGRADKGAAWALLARLYLNAKVYTGTEKNTEAVDYAKKVIGAGYSLEGNYRQLMLADNNLNRNEFILTINYDGVRTQGYGGTTFLTHAAVGGTVMKASDYGVGGGWGGIRTTKALTNLFPNADGSTDKRAQFFTNGQSLEINDIGTFTDGYAVTKFRNLKRDGTAGSSLDFADIDIPIFRLGEVYLIYAEAVLRGGTGGSTATAIEYVNKLRDRAYGNTSGRVASIDLNMILDERARELYWEGYRRTDLVRYGRFTEAGYLWPWKGGVKNGRGVDAHFAIFPLPSADITVNSNLKQNPGY